MISYIPQLYTSAGFIRYVSVRKAMFPNIERCTQLRKRRFKAPLTVDDMIVFSERDMMMMTTLPEIKLTQRRQEQHLQEILTLVLRQPQSPSYDAAHIADVTSKLENVEFPLDSL